MSSARDWLAWARRSGIHPWVVDYISQRPDHLASAAPRHEEPFSTPRAWHMLSDLLHSFSTMVLKTNLAAVLTAVDSIMPDPPSGLPKIAAGFGYRSNYSTSNL